MTIVKLAILGALAVAGIAAGWGRWANLDDRPPMTRDTLLAMASSFVYISYAYTGWNGASYLAGEVDDPNGGRRGRSADEALVTRSTSR